MQVDTATSASDWREQFAGMSMPRALSVHRALAAFVSSQDCRFTAFGEEVTALEILGPEAFLPVIALHGDAKFRELFGRPMPGVEFKNDPESLFYLYASLADLEPDTGSSARIAVLANSVVSIFGVTPKGRVETQPVYEAYKDGLLKHLERGDTEPWPTTALPR